MKRWWWNQKTGEAEFKEAPTTDEEAEAFLPQLPPVIGLYRAQRFSGNDTLDALETALRIAGEAVKH